MGIMKDIDIEIKNSPALSYLLWRIQKIEEKVGIEGKPVSGSP